MRFFHDQTCLRAPTHYDTTRLTHAESSAERLPC